MNQLQPLSENDLRALAPSVFATSPIDDVSERYRFIPTFEIIKRLQTEGWFPTKAQECRVTNEKNQGFQKHLIRFQRQDLILNGEAIEVVLINSHNRSAAYQLMAGVFSVHLLQWDDCRRHVRENFCEAHRFQSG